MTATAIDLNKLLDNGTTSNGATTAEPPANVTEFPQDGVRLQDLVLKLMLEGKSPADIATFVGKTPEVIERLCETELMAKALQNAVMQEGDDEGQNSVRNLLRAQAPRAVVTLQKLMKCGHPPTELNAVKTILEYTLIAAKEKDIEQGAKNRMKGMTPQKMEEEYKKTQEELERQRNKRPF